MIMSGDRLVPLFLVQANLRLHRGFIESDDVTMPAQIDFQGLAQGDEQMFLVHLRMSLDRLVSQAFGDRAQFDHRFLLQFLIGVFRHGLPPRENFALIIPFSASIFQNFPQKRGKEP